MPDECFRTAVVINGLDSFADHFDQNQEHAVWEARPTYPRPAFPLKWEREIFV